MRRDTILTSTADKMPELFRFFYTSLECIPKATMSSFQLKAHSRETL